MSKNGKNFKSSKRGSRGTKKDNRCANKATSSSRPYIEDQNVTNDPSWYTRNQQLAKDAARFSFNNPLGNAINVLPKDVFTNAPDGGFYPSGICVIPLIHGPGTSLDNSSPLNTASRVIYSYVRHLNSGHANYDPADMMMYLLALDNAYAWYSYVARMCGTLYYYSSRNKYIGGTLIRAQGFNWDNLKDHLSDVRYEMNRFITQINTLKAPADLDFFKRHSWLYSGIYADSMNEKAQLYMFKPVGFYFYQEKEEGKPGHLDFVNMKVLAQGTFQDRLTFEKIREINDKFISSLMLSEDIGIINGDIQKAYSSGSFYTLDTITDDYSVRPSYDEAVLSQIHNLTLVDVDPESGFAERLVINQQTDGAITWDPWFLSSEMGYKDDDKVRKVETHPVRLLDLRSQEPSPEEVFEATRMMAIPYTEEDSPTASVHVKCGTEIPLAAEIWSMVKSKEGEKLVKTLRVGKVGYAHEASQGARDMLTHFDYHPMVWRINSQGPSQSSAYLIGDVDNYTTITAAEVGRLHETAILSLWAVPESGQYKG